MMCRAALVLALIALPAGGVLAQKQVAIYASGTTALLIYPDVIRGSYNPSFGLNAGAGYQFAARSEAVAFFEYDPLLSADDVLSIINADGSEASVRSDGGELVLTGAAGGVKNRIMSASWIQPYLVGTLGIYQVKNRPFRYTEPSTGRLEEVGGRSRTGLGVNLGLGADIAVSRRFLFLLETKYTRVFDASQRSYVRVRFGVGFIPWIGGAPGR